MATDFSIAAVPTTTTTTTTTTTLLTENLFVFYLHFIFLYILFGERGGPCGISCTLSDFGNIRSQLRNNHKKKKKKKKPTVGACLETEPFYLVDHVSTVLFFFFFRFFFSGNR